MDTCWIIILETPVLCLLVKIHLNLRLKFHQCRDFPPILHVAVEFRQILSQYILTTGLLQRNCYFHFADVKPRWRKLWVDLDECAHFEMKSQGPPALKYLLTSLSALYWMQICHGIWALHYHGVTEHDLWYHMIDERLQYRPSFLSSMHSALHQSYSMCVSCGSSQDRSVFFFRHFPSVGNQGIRRFVLQVLWQWLQTKLLFSGNKLNIFSIAGKRSAVVPLKVTLID